MAKSLLVELIKSKKEFVREIVKRLGMRDELIWSLLAAWEAEVGMKSSSLASLINRVGESDGEGRIAAVAELSSFKGLNPDLFQSHMLHLSVPFQEFIPKQLNKYSQQFEMSSGGNIDDQNPSTKALDLPYQTTDSWAADSSRNSFSDLRARIEALEKKNSD